MASSAWSRREFLRRSVAAGGLVLGGATILGACTQTGGGGGSTLQTARDARSIRVGIAGEQPYGFTDQSGRVTGEAPEVARVVFRAIGIPEIEATQVEFGSLIPGLNARQFDVVAAGMFITPERCRQAAFSVPDYTAPTAFLVPRGNPQQVRRFEDISAKNLQLAVLSGAVEQGYAQDLGVPQNLIQVYDSQSALLQAVTGNRAYAAALTNISLNGLVKQNPNAPIEVTEPFNPVINGREQVSAGGFVFRTADNDLRTAFNTELQRIHDNGQWLQIVRPFGFSEENLPGPGVTTESECAAPAG